MEDILIIDGENFRHSIKQVLAIKNLEKELTIQDLSIEKLFDKVIGKNTPSKKLYYAAKIHKYNNIPEKSEEWVERQRTLKRKLEEEGFIFVKKGHLREQEIVRKGKKPTYAYHEKGVDVQIAVDIVSHAYEKTAKTIYLCSSDSDLQPAIHKAREQKLKIVYVGFENNPNKGLIASTNHNILIKDVDILECISRYSPWKTSKKL